MRTAAPGRSRAEGTARAAAARIGPAAGKAPVPAAGARPELHTVARRADVDEHLDCRTADARVHPAGRSLAEDTDPAAPNPGHSSSARPRRYCSFVHDSPVLSVGAACASQMLNPPLAAPEETVSGASPGPVTTILHVIEPSPWSCALRA